MYVASINGVSPLEISIELEILIFKLTNKKKTNIVTIKRKEMEYMPTIVNSFLLWRDKIHNVHTHCSAHGKSRVI